MEDTKIISLEVFAQDGIAYEATVKATRTSKTTWDYKVLSCRSGSLGELMEHEYPKDLHHAIISRCIYEWDQKPLVEKALGIK